MAQTLPQLCIELRTNNLWNSLIISIYMSSTVSVWKSGGTTAPVGLNLYIAHAWGSRELEVTHSLSSRALGTPMGRQRRMSMGMSGFSLLSGSVGAKGEKGSPGPVGLKGAPGAVGQKGDTGAKGKALLQGSLHNTGRYRSVCSVDKLHGWDGSEHQAHSGEPGTAQPSKRPACGQAYEPHTFLSLASTHD